MKVYLIHETNQQGEADIIGISSTPERAEYLIEEYYGGYSLLDHKDVRDSGIEWVRKIAIYRGAHEVVNLVLQSYEVDSIN
jgi:hypothetical protein